MLLAWQLNEAWSSLSLNAWVTLAVLVVTLVALIREIASPDLIMLGALAVLLLTGSVSAQKGLSGFSEEAVIAVGSLFVVAAVVRRTGALGWLDRFMRPRSARVVPAILRLMLPVSVVSSFMNNTPLVAILVPEVQRWGRQVGIAPSKLLIPLSYATILGGMATLVGTSTNVVVSGLLERETGRGLGMFELAWIGVPALIVGAIYFATIGHRLLPRRSDSAGGAAEDLRLYQFELLVPGGSALVHKTVEEAGLRSLRNAFLAHVIRDGQVFGPIAPDLVLQGGDILAFSGRVEARDEILSTHALAHVVEPVEATEAQHLPLFEAVVSANSVLHGKTLREVGFRERFQAVVIGVHRSGRRLKGPIGRTPLESGDLLLLEAPPAFARNWTGSSEFYLVAPIERADPVDTRRAPWVILLLIATISLAAFGVFRLSVVAFSAAVLAVFIGRLSPGEARRSLDLSVLLVIAAAFGIAGAMDQTGLDRFLAARVGELSSWIAPSVGPIGVLLVLYVATNLLTEILTNNVAAVMVLPIGLRVAEQLQIDARACAVVVAIAASASFATPIGYQTNLMVLGPGGYRFRDYLRVGLPLNFLILALTLCVVYARWL